LLTYGVADLIAHGKTRQEIAEHIGADEVIFQDLDGKDGLRAACMEAADSTSQVEDFEVGVFCGKYVTEVPEGYFEHLSDIRNGKSKRNTGITNIKAGDDEGGLVTSSGPVNGPSSVDEVAARLSTNGLKSPDHREDIRYVITDRRIFVYC
jgi:amidophosphoribosyltransferase